MKTRLAVVACIIAAAAAGWMIFRSSDPLRDLDDVDQMTLYSIDGDAVRYGNDVKDGEKFRYAPVLGKIEIKNVDDRRVVADAFKEGLKPAAGRGKECFWPRHALKVVSNNHTIDYLICFECEQVEVFEGPAKRQIHVGKSPQKVFNQYLQAADVPLSKGMPKDPD